MQEDYQEDEKFIFADFLEADTALKGVLDTFKTYGLMFECAIEENARQNLIEQSMTEKRNGVRGVTDEILEGQNTFYAIGAFLKVLHELGFRVEETTEEECDFCGVMICDEDRLQIDIEFSYGEEMVEYSINFSDEREHTGHTSTDDFLQDLFNGGWGLPKLSGVLTPSSLYDDLEGFMLTFRRSWSEYKKTLKEKGF
jgi:hypothetical protein